MTASTEPARVIVVEDPFNEYDAWSLMVSVIAAGISIFLTWRALKIGRQANQAAAKAAEEAEHANREASKARAAVANERRRMVELEALRDLLRYFDTRTIHAGSQRELDMAEILYRGLPWLALVPETELPTWRLLVKSHSSNGSPFSTVAAVVEERSPGTPASEILNVGRQILRAEVLVAIRRTVNERDD